MAIKNAATGHHILKLLAERWSPYGFEDRSVPEADLRSLFEAARHARSAMWIPSLKKISNTLAAGQPKANKKRKRKQTYADQITDQENRE